MSCSIIRHENGAVAKVLAPNGKESILYKSLIEDLGLAPETALKKWAMTQTRTFKHWFGDSKVLDKNGEPMIAYHGTNSDPFEIFNLSAAKSEKAIFFTTDIEVAKHYGKNVIPTFLNISSPYTKYEAEVNEVTENLKNRAQGFSITYRDVDVPNNQGPRDAWNRYYSDVSTPPAFDPSAVSLNTEDPSRNPDYTRYQIAAKSYIREAEQNAAIMELKSAEIGGKRYSGYYMDKALSNAKEEGADGLMLKNIADQYKGLGAPLTASDQILIVDNTKIKHATENFGTFTTPDMSPLLAEVEERYGLRTETGARKAVTNPTDVIDRIHKNYPGVDAFVERIAQGNVIGLTTNDLQQFV